MTKVSAIILNYNTHKDVVNCVNSIRKFVSAKIDFIIVDNNSLKESREYIRLQLADVTILENNVNCGYAAGNNIGIKYALNYGAENILIINPDVVVEDDFLLPLLKALNENTDIGIVTGKAFRKNSANIYTTGGRINLILSSVIPLQKKFINKLQNVKFISGCLMLVKKEVFEKVGLLEEKYFMYCEDLKFSFDVGKIYKLVYEPTSIFYHGSGAGNKLEEYTEIYFYYSIRNRILFFKETFPNLKYYFNLITLFIVFGKIILLVFIHKKKNKIANQILALCNGWFDGIRDVVGRNKKY